MAGDVAGGSNMHVVSSADTAGLPPPGAWVGPRPSGHCGAQQGDLCAALLLRPSGAKLDRGGARPFFNRRARTTSAVSKHPDPRSNPSPSQRMTVG